MNFFECYRCRLDCRSSRGYKKHILDNACIECTPVKFNHSINNELVQHIADSITSALNIPLIRMVPDPDTDLPDHIAPLLLSSIVIPPPAPVSPAPPPACIPFDPHQCKYCLRTYDRLDKHSCKLKNDTVRLLEIELNKVLKKYEVNVDYIQNSLKW